MTHPVALVTGASSGIGETTSLRLLDLGYTVYAAARRVERMAELGRRGARVLEVDVTDDDSVRTAVATIERDAGRLDVLVNNAGYGSYGAVEDVPLAEGRRQFDVNVFGVMRLTQLVLPMMRRQGSGRIINVSSVGGRIYTPFGAWYHGTKFALEGMSDALRVELAPFGIDVVVIQPGAIRTEWGAIAAQGLRDASGGTAYGEHASSVVRTMTSDAFERRLSDPSVIAEVIARAVTARRPRTRYSAGSGAKPVLALRRLTSDRMFDRIVALAAR